MPQSLHFAFVMYRVALLMMLVYASIEHRQALFARRVCVAHGATDLRDRC